MLKRLCSSVVLSISCGLGLQAEPLTLEPGSRIVLVGNGLGARMMNYGHFETELHLRYPDHKLFIRNMCDEGNTPGYRPHSARPNPYAFKGAEKYRSVSATKDRWGSSGRGKGSYQTPDQWLTELQADVVVGVLDLMNPLRGQPAPRRFGNH